MFVLAQDREQINGVVLIVVLGTIPRIVFSKPFRVITAPGRCN